MESKKSLDRIINKSRVHLYKPIQLAEILYHYRNGANVNPSDLESYRNPSKSWRDRISRRLVGRASTSSQKFQDNLFEANAMPPRLLRELAEFNNEHGGLVESYIYHKLKDRLSMVRKAQEYLRAGSPEDFDLGDFLSLFTRSPGLRRSVDKVYEILVYALFSTIVRALNVEVSLKVNNVDKEIIRDFGEFIELVLGLPKGETSLKMPARLFRVGVTNAADRGLDMWANFGPAVQVKHVSLNEDFAEDVSWGVSADRIVLVCLDAEADVVKRVTCQLPFSNRIQGIITIADLDRWYRTCLCQKYRAGIGRGLLSDIEREFSMEFPSSKEIGPFLEERGYDSFALTGEWRV
jgi:type II restriction enzyme